MKKFFGEFKKFIQKGSVIDLAVGVIMGSAFTAVVNAVTKGIFTPFINWILKLVLGKNSLSEVYTFLVKVPATDGTIDLANSIFIDWGTLVNAIINFFLIALILFFIVRTVNRAKGWDDVFEGYTKEEYKKMRKSGLTRQQIVEKAKERDAKIAEEEKAKQEEAKKHTTEGLLEQIKTLLEEQAKK